ncbi:CRISPR-associated protein Cas5 [Scytonema sp. NUACC21]
MPKQSNNANSPPLRGEGLGERLERVWLTVSYQPVSLFTLKRSDATSMAARSNLVPTPYAIKMALLKALLESQGKQHQDNFDTWIKREFTWIRDLQIYILPPEQLVVNRNGYKLRYYDQTADKADKSRTTVPMQDGFVFREWIHFQGELQICVGIHEDESNKLQELTQLFAQINYFGKKGCFFQYLPDRTQTTNQPTFIPNPNDSFTIQPMDDFSSKTTFNRINPFSNDKAQLDKDRIIKPGFLPLKLRSTSARYDFYQRD